LRGEINNKWVVEVNYIEHASVPVIKLKCSLATIMEQAGFKFPKNSKYKAIYMTNFSIDITHKTEMHNGLACVDLVKKYLMQYWFLEPLILVLKQMLKVNGLNDPYKGGLSSYGLLLLIVAFL
jgi:DNA polymerase sigma